VFPFPFPRPQGPQKPPPFGAQRGLCAGVVVMTVGISVGALVARPEPTDAAPFDVLDPVLWAFAPAAMVLALVLRVLLARRADAAEGQKRAFARFQSRLAPIALLEGAALMAAINYFLGAADVPSLVFMGAVPALMILLVPLSDPDADEPQG